MPSPRRAVRDLATCPMHDPRPPLPASAPPASVIIITRLTCMYDKGLYGLDASASLAHLGALFLVHGQLVEPDSVVLSNMRQFNRGPRSGCNGLSTQMTWKPHTASNMLSSRPSPWVCMSSSIERYPSDRATIMRSSRSANLALTDTLEKVEG